MSVGTNESSPLKHQTQLKLLNAISNQLQRLVESENFYQEVINIIQSHLHPDGIHIWSRDPNGTIILRAQTSREKSFLSLGHCLRESEGIVGYTARTKKSVLANDVSQDPHYTNLSLPMGTQSELSVPILDGETVVAVINIESNRKNSFDHDDVIAIEAIASQIAVAMMNQSLFSQVKTFNGDLKRLVEEKTQELRKAHEQILGQQKLLQKENKALRSLIHQDSKTLEMVGSSPALQGILAMVDKIAPTRATVLIQGESGTGKELIARRLHFKSDRANSSYVAVNCGALQETLLESELFGHEKGSFTGAVAQKIGLCETADGGTLFLDEIGEMSIGIQAKLLRFLQEGEFYRIGAKNPIRVDVRLISATNRNLEKEVKEGRFREDLFYRLNTITLRMPPLRERRDDIPELVDFFFKSSRFGGPALQAKRIHPSVIEAFRGYEWPGNIRELQNTIERLKILSEGPEITLEDLPRDMMGSSPAEIPNPLDPPASLSLELLEKNHILRTLAHHHGNKTKTAQSLGITIKTLYNKLYRYGVIQPEPSAETQAH